MIESPTAFANSLPRGPLRQHIVEVYTSVVFLYGHNPHGVQAVNIAAHSLREIAIHTSTPDWVRDGIRREVLDEFTQALAQITATDPNQPRGIL